jgi:anti-anti-sigma regulatory factor
MTFKIERFVARENELVFRVCGEIQTECVTTLKELIEADNAEIVLDLSDVTLADRDAAMFLAVCELKGVELRNCPAFLREWIAKEQAHITP